MVKGEDDLKTEDIEELFDVGATADAVITAEDEILPVSYENVEEALLAMFIQDDDVAQHIAKSGLRDVHFSKRKNKIMFPLILNVRLDKSACTYDFVADRLERESMPDGESVLDYVGGLQEISKIVACCPAVIDLKVAQSYVDIIFSQYKLSRVKDEMRWIINQRKFDESKIVDRIAAIQQVISDNTIGKQGLIPLDVLLTDAYERYMDRRNNPEKHKGFKTGFYWLDKNRAIDKRQVAVIGAKTTVGKSVLVSNIITRMMLDDAKILLFTPELNKGEYIDRLMCAESKVPIDRWKEGIITNEENIRYGLVQDKLLKKAQNLYIEDRGTQSCNFILSSIRKHMLNHVVDVVVVDYLQDLRYYGDNTKRAITDTMQKFCAFAKDNNVALIVLSQLKRTDRAEPEKEDLKESGDIENMADCIILLHRISITTHGERAKGWYKIAKNRQGPITDNVPLTFMEDYLKFIEDDRPVDGVTDEGTFTDGYDDNYNDIADGDMPTEQTVVSDIIKRQGTL